MGHGSVSVVPSAHVGIFAYTVKLVYRYQKSNNANEIRAYKRIPMSNVASFDHLRFKWWGEQQVKGFQCKTYNYGKVQHAVPRNGASYLNSP